MDDPLPFVKKKIGLVRDLNPGPLAPKARIIPLDQRAIESVRTFSHIQCEIHVKEREQLLVFLLNYLGVEYLLKKESNTCSPIDLIKIRTEIKTQTY